MHATLASLAYWCTSVRLDLMMHSFDTASKPAVAQIHTLNMMDSGLTAVSIGVRGVAAAPTPAAPWAETGPLAGPGTPQHPARLCGCCALPGRCEGTACVGAAAAGTAAAAGGQLAARRLRRPPRPQSGRDLCQSHHSQKAAFRPAPNVNRARAGVTGCCKPQETVQGRASRLPT